MMTRMTTNLLNVPYRAVRIILFRGDKHLLKLKEYEGIKIINAADFLSFL